MVLSPILQENVAGKYSGFELVSDQLTKVQLAWHPAHHRFKKLYGSITCALSGVNRLA
jgi:hypothetical protein